MEIAKENQDIFFTDREGRRNTECLSWGIDKERVLRGRTGIEDCVNLGKFSPLFIFLQEIGVPFSLHYFG